MIIRLYTCISKNSSDYADFLYHTCEALKSGFFNKIEYYFIESNDAEKLPTHWIKLGERKENLKCGSLNNGACLNILSTMLEFRSDIINVFIDPDIAILLKYWDRYLVSFLDTKYDCVSIADFYPDRKQPSVMFLAFKNFPNKKIETPNFSTKIVKHKNSSKVTLIVRDGRKQDAGCRIPTIFNRILTLPFIRFNSPESLLPRIPQDVIHKLKIGSANMSEWQIDGDVFCSHKQESYTHPIDGLGGTFWKNRCLEYLHNTYRIYV